MIEQALWHILWSVIGVFVVFYLLLYISGKRLFVLLVLILGVTANAWADNEICKISTSYPTKADLIKRTGIYADEYTILCVDGYKWLGIINSNFRVQTMHINQIFKVQSVYNSVPVPCTCPPATLPFPVEVK